MPATIPLYAEVDSIDSLSPNDSNCCAPNRIPSELSALNPDEIYLQVGGGGITIDDVTVIREEEFGGLQLYQKYLFFISQNHSHPIVMVQLGADGIFKVNKDNSLEPIAASKSSDEEQAHNRVKSTIYQDLERLHGNSLARLIATIKANRKK